MEMSTVKLDDWSLSDERQFVENLVQQRFNFLLVVFSFVIAGAMGATSQIKLNILLGVGSVVCTLVSLTVYRAHVKLDQILKVLHKTPGHPVALSGEMVEKLGWQGLFSATAIIGVIVPYFCSLCLIFGFILSCANILKAR